MKESQLKFKIALSMVRGVGLSTYKRLTEIFGNEEEVLNASAKSLSKLPGIGDAIVEQLKHPQLLERAKKELDYLRKSNGFVVHFDDEAFPYRLKECDDHPIFLYGKGEMQWDERRVIGIVGTRKMTPYGKTHCEEILTQLANNHPNLLVVSGLAYGVDACAHRKAMELGLQTIGVVGHGLDMIYPASHKDLATRMMNKGGILTEFHSHSLVDRKNFVSRNRIIAGLCDVVLIVESGEKGGALLTAEFGNSYNREVCAIPGRVGDSYSKGCNNLIKRNEAAMIENAEDIEKLMNWDTKQVLTSGMMYDLFPTLSEEQQKVVDYLREKGKSQINIMTRELNFSYSTLSSLLFEMEMQDWVLSYPGGIYDLR